MFYCERGCLKEMPKLNLMQCSVISLRQWDESCIPCLTTSVLASQGQIWSSWSDRFVYCLSEKSEMITLLNLA